MPLPHGISMATIPSGMTPTGPYTGNSTKTACPRCAENGEAVLLRSTGGQGHLCPRGHKYDSMDELRIELARVKPATIKGTAQKVVLPGQCKVEVILKEKVRDGLRAKYGDRLEGIVAAHLAALCEDMVVFAGDDLKMLRDGLGEKNGNAFELAARAKNIRVELAEASNRAQSAATTAAVPEGPGSFRVKLSDAHTKQVQELARARNIRAGEVLKNGIEWNLDSNNF